MSEENQVGFFGGAENVPVLSPQALMQSSAAIPKGSDKPYLSFKDGEWTFGSDAQEVEDGSIWAVNPHSIQFGLVEWLDSTAGAEILVPAGTAYSAKDLALKFDDTDKDHRITPQIACDMYCVNGEDEGLQVCFKTSTKGGVDALNKIIQSIAKQGVEDPEHIVAMLELSGSSYMHKKYKRKTYVPVLTLRGFDNFEFTATKGKGSKKTKPATDRVADKIEDVVEERADTAPTSKRRTRRSRN